MADTDKPVRSDPNELIGKTVSHYAVQEVLGGGGMGVVYLAEDTRLQRPVALKFLPPALSQDARSKERFLAEAQAASALDHPNICTVHEFGETDNGRLFIAMAYYAGESLRQKFDDGPLGAEESLDYAIQIVRGLAAAHAAGIVHRDIKPANVVVTEDGVAKIVDFGIARVGEAHLTQTGATVGTTGYMSPEQTRGEEVDGRADIWALGVVLYEALTGVRPFRGNYDQAVIYSILHEDPEPMTSVNPGVSSNIEVIVDKCLQKSPAMRYQDAEALLADLEAVQKGAAPETVSLPPSHERRSRSKKLMIAAAALLALVLAVVFGRRVVLPGEASAGRVVRVAVLPFVNVSGDSTDQAFIDGLGYTVSATLTEMEQFEDRLSVLPADVEGVAALSPREAAQTLNADFLVTGSVQRAADRVRLTLNLYDAEIDAQTRSAILDNEATNMLALQDSVAQVLAGLLDIELSASDQETLSAGGTSSPDAFDDYTRAQGYLLNYEDERNIDLAILHFERAIENDARYVLAHAGLGEAYWRKYEVTNDPRWVELASETGNNAVRLSSNLAPVRIIVGRIYKGTGQYDEAEQEFLRALEIDSTNALAHQQLAATYYYLGRLEEAETHYLRALELKPGYWSFHNNLGFLYSSQGRHEEAIRVYRRVIDLRPSNPWGYNNVGIQYDRQGMLDSAAVWYLRATEVNPDAVGPTALAHNNLGFVHFVQRNFVEATRMFERSVELDTASADVWMNLAAARYWASQQNEAKEAWQRAIVQSENALAVNPNSAGALMGLAMASAMTGEPDRARRMLSRLDALPNKHALTYLHMTVAAEQLGDRVQGLRYLEEGFSSGLTTVLVESSPWLDSLRSDPDFEALLRRTNSRDVGR